MRAGKGYCLAEIIIKGREAHSAYPAMGTSAVFGAARLITAIENVARKLQNGTTRSFRSPLHHAQRWAGAEAALRKMSSRLNAASLWSGVPLPGQDPGRLLDLVSAAIEE